MKNMAMPEVTINKFDEAAINEIVKQIDTISELYGPHQPILINVDSFGGSIYGLAKVYEKLQSIDNKVITYTSSKQMSAGAILLSSGSPGLRIASPNSSIMIHEMQAGAMGDIKDIIDTTTMISRENERWMGILAKNMNMSKKSIRDLIRERSVGQDLYLTANEALQLKLVDHVGYVNRVTSSLYSYEILATPHGKPKAAKATKKAK